MVDRRNSLVASILLIRHVYLMDGVRVTMRRSYIYEIVFCLSTEQNKRPQVLFPLPLPSSIAIRGEHWYIASQKLQCTPWRYPHASY
ncbi:hypothetical protein F5146DRAFT_1060721 [Armillaria mellea]|nr:hypothetical protein F5146DRAFT_1060721 [Armillaria mellea]